MAAAVPCGPTGASPAWKCPSNGRLVGRSPIYVGHDDNFYYQPDHGNAVAVRSDPAPLSRPDRAPGAGDLRGNDDASPLAHASIQPALSERARRPLSRRQTSRLPPEQRSGSCVPAAEPLGGKCQARSGFSFSATTGSANAATSGIGPCRGCWVATRQSRVRRPPATSNPGSESV